MLLPPSFDRGTGGHQEVGLAGTFNEPTPATSSTPPVGRVDPNGSLPGHHVKGSVGRVLGIVQGQEQVLLHPGY